MTASSPPRDCREGLIRRVVHESRPPRRQLHSHMQPRQPGVPVAVHMPWATEREDKRRPVKSGARLNGFRQPVCSPVSLRENRGRESSNTRYSGEDGRALCGEATDCYSTRARPRGAIVWA